MLYLKNALGGLGRSVTDTARLAFGRVDAAVRWRKLALYAAIFVLPGGSLAVLLFMWAERRRAQRAAAAAAGSAVVQSCTGGQPACRSACGSRHPRKSAR